AMTEKPNDKAVEAACEAEHNARAKALEEAGLESMPPWHEMDARYRSQAIKYNSIILTAYNASLDEQGLRREATCIEQERVNIEWWADTVNTFPSRFPVHITKAET
ncbi:MAG: hypothetical protein ACRCUC_02275, partial [Aestuariivirga sp.]